MIINSFSILVCHIYKSFKSARFFVHPPAKVFQYLFINQSDKMKADTDTSNSSHGVNAGR